MSQRNKRRQLTPEEAWQMAPQFDLRSYKPVHDYIVVKMLGPQETASGLILVEDEDNDEITMRAYVVAMGPGRESEITPGHKPAPPCQVGDYIEFLPMALCSVCVPYRDMSSDSKCFIIRFRDVMGILGRSPTGEEVDCYQQAEQAA